MKFNADRELGKRYEFIDGKLPDFVVSSTGRIGMTIRFITGIRATIATWTFESWQKNGEIQESTSAPFEIA